MPTITAYLEDLEKLACRRIGRDDFPPLLALSKAELKSIDEATGEMKIEMTDTNRPDLWCVEGIARQIRLADGGKNASHAFFSAPSAELRRIEVDASVEKARPFIAGFEVDGLSVTDEMLKGLIETQEKLCEAYGRRRKAIAIGVYNAEKIAWPVRYEAVPPSGWKFVPLGAAREMNLAEILSEHPKGVEYRHILEEMDEYPILYDSTGLTLSFPPIINSRDLGEVMIGDSRLFVEATGTDIRKVMHALNILAANLADRGGRITHCSVEYPYETPLGRNVVSPRPVGLPVELDPGYLGKFLGVEAKAAEIKSALEKYGCSAEIRGRGPIMVSAPPYRLDYMHPCDAVEDYAISCGLSRFEPSMPSDFTVGGLAFDTDFEDAVRDLLVGFGFEEVFSNILSSPDSLRTKMNLPHDGLVEIENAMSATFSAARDRILPCLLEVEALSVKAAFPHRTFETGEACVLDGAESKTVSVTAALMADEQASFSSMQSYLNLLMYCTSGAIPELKPCEKPFFISGRGAEIVSGGSVAGLIGELHPQVLENWGLKTPAAFFEILTSSLIPREAGVKSLRVE